MRSARALTLLLVVFALVSLTACTSTPAPIQVSPGSVSLDTTQSAATLTLSNTSNSTVSWSASSSDTTGRVALSQSSGSLTSGTTATITVGVDYYGLSKGAAINATISVTPSTGAPVDVPLTFTMSEGGLDACGTAYPSTFGLSVSSTTPGAAAPTVVPPMTSSGGGPPYVPGEVLVVYAAGSTTQGAAAQARASQLAAAVRADHHLQLVRAGTDGGPDLVHVNDVQAAVASLRADSRVRAAQPNYYLHPMQVVPNDPLFKYQWNMQEFGMEQAWSQETGASNPTVIAIIDTGVDMNHPDLKAKMLPGCDFYYGDVNANPGTGDAPAHGTHVAGIAAAIGNNTTGVAGVAFDVNAKILPIKIFDNSGSYATSAMLIDAIRWAAGLPVTGVATNPHPADVINMSLGVAGDEPAVDVAAQDAFDQGSLLVAAAGNYGPGQPYTTNPGVISPANAPYVIAVGSVDSNYHRSGFSATDLSTQSLASRTGVELMAPGGLEVSGSGAFSNCLLTITEASGDVTGDGIVSTYPTSSGSYACDVGTSMASPFVAGIAALLKSANPGWTPTQVRNALDASVLYDNTYMSTSNYGNGVACADEALGASTVCGQ